MRIAGVSVAVIALIAGCSTEKVSTPAATADPIDTTTEPTAPTLGAATTAAATTTVATAEPTPSDPLATSAPPSPPTTAPAPVPTSDNALIFISGERGVGLPIGRWSGTDWANLGDDPTVLPVTTGETAQVASLGAATAVTIGELTDACHDLRVGPRLGTTFPPPETPGFGYSVVGVVGGWSLVPRPPRLVGLDVPEYQTIGEQFADDLGLPGASGDVVQVVRTDLDGNGIEEVVVAFEHEQESVIGAAGDFSIVYVRLPAADGTVDDVVLFSSFVDPDLGPEDFPFWQQARVMATADLNGDGAMELVLRDWYYEGAGATVWELDDDGITQVLGGGCGA